MSVDVADKIHVKLLSNKEYNDFENKEIVITDFTVDSEEFKTFIELTDDIDKNDVLQIKERAKGYFSSKNELLSKIKNALTNDRLYNNTVYFYVQLAEYFQLLFPTYFAMLEYYTLNKRRYEFEVPKPLTVPEEVSESEDEEDECEEIEKNEIDEEEDEISDLEDIVEDEEEEQDEIKEDPIPQQRPEEPKIKRRSDIKLPSTGLLPTPQIDIKEIEKYINFIPRIRTRVIDRNGPKMETENHTDAAFKPMKTFELADGFSRHDFDHEYRDPKNKRIVVTITDIRFN